MTPSGEQDRWGDAGDHWLTLWGQTSQLTVSNTSWSSSEIPTSVILFAGAQGPPKDKRYDFLSGSAWGIPGLSPAETSRAILPLAKGVFWSPHIYSSRALAGDLEPFLRTVGHLFNTTNHRLGPWGPEKAKG
jgi:hypothetical protein